MKFLLDFITIYSQGVYFLLPLFGALLGIIVVLGLRIGYLEGWHFADSVYYALVCATSLGAGTLHPTERRTRWMTVAISLFGVLFVGLVVSIGLEAVSHAFRQARGVSAPIIP